MGKPKIRAAVYARYSSDIQNDKSIDDQISLCRNLAKRHGFTISEDFIFTDRAKTGATMFERDGLLSLMMAAKKRNFDVVLSESLSRLSRDDVDTPDICKRLNFEDIKIYDQNGLVTNVHVGVGSIVNSMFLKNLGDAVRRHHNGRAMEGIIPGSIAYGYRQKPGGKNGEREIDPEKAKVVVRIFEEYVGGKSMRDMALDLARDGIESPSGKSYWHIDTFTSGRGGGGMIMNQLYVGKLIWNDFRTIRNPDTGKPVRRKNAPEDVIITDVPHLRIVSDKLFAAANDLRKRRGQKAFGPTGKRPISSKAKIDNLISNLLVCGKCNGHMIVNKSRSSRSTPNQVVGPRVACSAANYHGTCDHRKSYDLKTLERTMMQGIRSHLTSTEAIIEYTKSYHARWAERQKASRGELEGARQQLNRITVQIDRLISAITDSDDPVPALMAKMKKLEAERVGLAEKVRLIEAEGNVIDLHPKAIKRFSSDMDELCTAMTSNPTKITDQVRTRLRSALENVFDRIIVHPTAARAQYEVTPYARMSAIMGIELFPKMREAKEMLAERGGKHAPKSRTTTARGPGDWNSDNRLICLGRWKQAA